MLDFAELHDVADAHAVDERTCYDMPTVKPPPAQAFAQLRQTFGAAADGIDNPNGRYSTPAPTAPTYAVHVVPVDNLRTVPMPNLRSPDCRTSDDKTRAELVRLVDCLQALTLRVEELERGRND